MRLLLLVTSAVVLAIGCGGTHLGADHGDAYRRALLDQQQSDTALAPRITADDAPHILNVHHGIKPGTGAPVPGLKSSGLSSDLAPTTLGLGGKRAGSSGSMHFQGK